MKRFILGVILTCCIASPSLAAQVPNYDINATCKEVANAGGGSAVIELQCRKDETAARERVASMNPSSRVWGTCREVGAFMGAGSYVILEQCIKNESEAERALGR